MMYKTTDIKALIPKAALAACVSAVAIVFSHESAEGVKTGIFFCTNTLVPSLFPFMFISVFVAQSGVGSYLGRALRKPTRMLFGLSGELSAAILMSVIGGYPSGAGMIASLLDGKRISKKEAKRAGYFSFASGAGFLITFVGKTLTGSAEAGACIYAAQVCSVIILGIAGRIIFGKSEEYNSDTKMNSPPPLSHALIEAAAAATRNMIEMCGIVILFSALIGVIEAFCDSPILFSLLEVTRGVSGLSKSKNIVMIAFMTGFGGLCVHFQIFGILRKTGINKVLFFLFRIIQGILTALFSKFLIRITGVSVPVFSSVSYVPRQALSTTSLGSVLLIATGVCLLFSVRSSNAYNQR